MKYQLSLSEDELYGILKVSEPPTIESIKQMEREVTKFIDDKNIEGILIDVRNAPFVESPSSQYYLVNQTFPEYGVRKQTKRAILVSPDDFSHDFIETAAQNAGYNMRIFNDYEEARGWLLK